LHQVWASQRKTLEELSHAEAYEYRDRVARMSNPESLQQCETPDKAADMADAHSTHPHLTPTVNVVRVAFNTRRKVKGIHLLQSHYGHHFSSSREVFRLAIVTSRAR